MAKAGEVATNKGKKPMAKVFLLKLDYIDQNLVTGDLVNDAEDYKYSSSKFYVIGLDEFDIIAHYKGD